MHATGGEAVPGRGKEITAGILASPSILYAYTNQVENGRFNFHHKSEIGFLDTYLRLKLFTRMPHRPLL